MKKASSRTNTQWQCHYCSTLTAYREQIPDLHLLSVWTVMSQAGNDIRAMEQVTALLQGTYLAEKRLAYLQTAVAESTHNAIEHGNQYSSDKVITLQVRVSPELIAVRICDQGEHLFISDPPDLQSKLAEHRTSRGWGLYLIAHLVDHWQFYNQPHGHTIELFMHREPVNTAKL